MTLSGIEIMKIVNCYIGVEGGYLGDFSYKSHAEFYPLYCGLEIDPSAYEGTTRERFISILKSSTKDVQAKIIRGVLEKFPLDSEEKPKTRTKDLYEELCNLAFLLEKNISPVCCPELQITSEVVEKTIRDVEVLLEKNGALSGVDRIHTTLDGYFRALCKKFDIAYEKKDTASKIFKTLRRQHTAFQNVGEYTEEIEHVLNSFANIIDKLNPIRNQGSIAHANENLLGEDEAMLVINVTRTLLQYIDAKVNG